MGWWYVEHISRRQRIWSDFLDRMGLHGTLKQNAVIERQNYCEHGDFSNVKNVRWWLTIGSQRQLIRNLFPHIMALKIFGVWLYRYWFDVDIKLLQALFKCNNKACSFALHISYVLSNIKWCLWSVQTIHPGCFDIWRTCNPVLQSLPQHHTEHSFFKYFALLEIFIVLAFCLAVAQTCCHLLRYYITKEPSGDLQESMFFRNCNHEWLQSNDKWNTEWYFRTKERAQVLNS